jgi:hypothetical protein
VDLRFAVVAEQSKDMDQLRMVSLLTDALVESGASVTHATGFGWDDLGVEQAGHTILARSGLARFGSDVIVALRRLGTGTQVRAVDTTGAPLLDQVIEVRTDVPGTYQGYTRTLVRGVVSTLMERGQKRYPFGSFEIHFRDLPLTQEEQLTKLIYTLPEVQRAELMVRQALGNGGTVSRWLLRATNLSNVHLQARIQSAVEGVARTGRFVMDGREVRVETTTWRRLEAWVVGSRLVGFRGVEPLASRPTALPLPSAMPPVIAPASAPVATVAPRPIRRTHLPGYPEWKPW